MAYTFDLTALYKRFYEKHKVKFIMYLCLHKNLFFSVYFYVNLKVYLIYLNLKNTALRKMLHAGAN